MSGGYDVIVVGGGHNGLVAAGYLAKADRRMLVCERRDTVGGAAVSEHPFGPDFTVITLSYVVSLLPADLVRDLHLTEYGYHVYPQGPYFAPRRDGGYLALPYERGARWDQSPSSPPAMPPRTPAGRSGSPGWPRSSALLLQIPPKVGSKQPRELLRQATLAAKLLIAQYGTGPGDVAGEPITVYQVARASPRLPGQGAQHILKGNVRHRSAGRRRQRDRSLRSMTGFAALRAVRRNGRHALHSFPRLPTVDNWDDAEFMIGGWAEPVVDAAVRRRVHAAHNDVVTRGSVLFELGVARAVHKHRGHGRAIVASWTVTTGTKLHSSD